MYCDRKHIAAYTYQNDKQSLVYKECIMHESHGYGMSVA